MQFVSGTEYQNASGRFRVVSLGPAMMKVTYSSGPQTGRTLIKRIADMARLATTAAPPSAPTAARGCAPPSAASPAGGDHAGIGRSGSARGVIGR